MLAPVEKLQSGVNRIMQIEVTRKCDLFNCSNCTRLLPFRQDEADAPEMSPDIFRVAVESMEGWWEAGGIVAMFGGNPTTHSAFPELCRILAERVPPENRGLWANSLGRHGSIAATTFSRGVLNLNAHGSARAADQMDAHFPGRVIPGSGESASWHSAILADRRDLGVTDDDWVRARESCDINQKWSGIIQQLDGQAVGYFCEIAGALDAVTGRRNGITVFPGWWRTGMDAFEGQVRNCCDQGCGVPLRLKGHRDLDLVYDVTSSWAAGKLPAPTGKVCIDNHVDAQPESTYETTDYLAFRGSK
jgi:hypothetical protein